MITIQGKGVSGGIAKGPLHFFCRPVPAVVKTAAENLEQEKERLLRARQQSAVQLTAMAAGCEGESAALLETHAMLAEDEDFAACMDGLLEQERCTAEYAVQQAGEQFAALFAALDDPYMRERAADIRDVAHRILDNLVGYEQEDLSWDEPVILAAEDLAPSETVRLDRSKILGFVTSGGSDQSHTAILARTMGIPAICAVGEGLDKRYQGCLCCMDGESGMLVVEPDQSTLSNLEKEWDRQRAWQQELEQLKGREDVTPDGQTLKVCCSIGAPEEVDAVLEHDGQGIGLFRTEFLFMRGGRMPTEEEQFLTYRRVVQAMEGKRVVIRTLDVGADKRLDWLALPKEENPALGMRGVRLCLSRPDLFKTQLRAIYRASAYGKAAIMFPMITSLWEVSACKEFCRQVMKELDEEGTAYNKDTEIGIMIETPAAAIMAEELAKEVDFFSVGTNDLAQYILACDRQSDHLEQFRNAGYSSVLRAVKMAADGAHKAGIWVGICGELGRELKMLPTFLAMGIDELSVPPSAVLPVRREIRKTKASNCNLNVLNQR